MLGNQMEMACIAAERLAQGNTATERPRRLSTETKAEFKTTEFWIYVAATDRRSGWT